jgi:hypothetical protein
LSASLGAKGLEEQVADLPFCIGDFARNLDCPCFFKSVMALLTSPTHCHPEQSERAEQASVLRGICSSPATCGFLAHPRLRLQTTRNDKRQKFEDVKRAKRDLGCLVFVATLNGEEAFG